MRFSLDGWDPSYGTSVEIQELAETTSRVDTTPEVANSGWAPIAPDSATPVPETVLFVDGVRRIDARAWIDDLEAPGGEGNRAVQGLCASYAVGVVRVSPAGAEIIAAEVRRGLFSDATTAASIETGFGSYVVHRTAADPTRPAGVSLTNALQRALADLELTVAIDARDRHGDNPSDDNALLVADGSLRGKGHLSRALGYVKTHGVQYLPPDLNGVVAELRTGDRSPVFVIASGWDRYSWYLRLPCMPAGPWAGIVRLEAAADRSLEEVVSTANMTQCLFGRFASVEYKDPRAPQNLVPIAGLEKYLRHQLGDPTLLYRSLRSAASAAGV